MPNKISRKKSRCKGCPLDGATLHKCYGVSDSEHPEVALIGEAPGAEEDHEGVPFVGPSGRMLKHAVNETGHMWHKSHKTNVIICRPPKNNFNSPEAQEAIERCRPGFLEELQELKKRGTKILVAVGASALKALNIEGSISKYRGSIFLLKFNKEGEIEETHGSSYDFIMIPTYHPSFLLRGQIKHEVTFANDLDKAYQLVGTNYKPPKENFVMFPTIEQLEKFADEIIAKKKPIGVDIETSGFIPGRARIIVVGIATSETDAFSIPFASQGGKQYWKTTNEYMRAQDVLKRLMDEVPTIFQNYLFDGRHLRRFGTPVKNLVHDTMVLNHTISPELLHNLGYIVSVYGKTPYWKEEVLKSDKRMIDLPDEQFRRYNLRDCVTLLQCLKPMIEEARERKVYHIYKEIAMPVLSPVIDMIETGFLLDTDALKKWKRTIKTKITKLEQKLRLIGNLPEEFNLTSGDHLRWLLYGVEPAQYGRAKALVKEIEENPKRRTDTKTYRENSAIVAAFENTQPFGKVNHTRKKTESGSLSVDEEAMLNMQIATSNRLSAIKKLRRPQEKHVEERQNLELVTSFIGTYREFAEWQKLGSTYSDFPREADNRVRFPYRTTGTATGRMSSGNKRSGEPGSAQNIPKEAKHLFIAALGKTLVQPDYSTLELRVLAEISDDDVSRAVFAAGLNAHSENCKVMFNITEKDKLWDSARKACKTYIFGRNYGGGLQGIYRRVAKQVPELNLTFAHFQEIDEKYRKKHPKYVQWVNTLTGTLRKDRCLENAFGRKRYFLGSDAEIIREGLNYPIQSTAADILNVTLIKLQKLISTKVLRADIVCSVHDSIVFEVPDGQVKKAVRIIKKTMEAPFVIGGNKVSFPVDIEVGKNWGSLTKLEIDK